MNMLFAFLTLIPVVILSIVLTKSGTKALTVYICFLSILILSDIKNIYNIDKKLEKKLDVETFIDLQTPEELQRINKLIQERMDKDGSASPENTENN